MNRVNISFLTEKTNLRKNDIESLASLCEPKPDQIAWKSEKFPIYPLNFDLYLSNPPFNKITICLPEFFRTNIEILGSSNSKDFFKIEEINLETDDFESGTFVTKFFKESHYYHYLRLKMHEPKIERKGHKQQNICKQVGLRAIEVSNINLFNTKYLCNLKKRLELHPSLFSLMQLLEYKYLTLSKEKASQHTNFLKDKYAKRINEYQSMIFEKKFNPVHPPESLIQVTTLQFQQLLAEPLWQPEQLDVSDPISLKQNIKKLEQELAQFYVDRLNTLHKNVTDYFQKYWNVQIRDIYLRLLSSPENQDHLKALVEFWAEVKELEQIQPNVQEATLMFINYYIEFMHNPLKVDALKILSLFAKIPNTGFKLYNVYQRILYNLINGLKTSENSQLYKMVYKSIFTIYRKIPNNVFMNEFINKETHPKKQMKLKKLQILEKITTNDSEFQVEYKEPIVEFLLDILLIKDLTVPEKNRVYNVVAFLAGTFGKENVMNDFEQLNSMILMNMEKIVDKKVSILKLGHSRAVGVNGELRSMCDYCGEQNVNFKDENIYDIHCYKECRVLTACEHCSSIVEIVDLQKHYLQECNLKNKFKNCDNCNEVIFIDKEQDHQKKCPHNFVTKCPLCQQKLESKLRLKEHLLKGSGCPNNPRNPE